MFQLDPKVHKSIFMSLKLLVKTIFSCTVNQVHFDWDGFLGVLGHRRDSHRRHVGCMENLFTDWGESSPN